jgi:hypothetical protein
MTLRFPKNTGNFRFKPQFQQPSGTLPLTHDLKGQTQSTV